MSDKIFNLIVIPFMVYIFSSCNPKGEHMHSVSVVGAGTNKVMEYDQNLGFDLLLKRTDSSLNGIWDPPIRMYGNKEFLMIYDHADNYYDDFFRVFEMNRYTDSERMISVFAAQKLDFVKYLRLSKRSVQLFKERKVNDDVLFFMLFPNGWKTKWRYAEQYNNPEVHGLLKEAISSNNLSYRSQIIFKRLYTGTIWKEHKENMKNGGPEY